MLTLLILVVICALFIVPIYNKVIKLRNSAKEAFAITDIYHKQRWDLIPNLVESVRGYVQIEDRINTDITNLRSNNYLQLSNTQKIETNSSLDSLLNKFAAITENNPDLKDNTNFMQLNNQLKSIETDIANAKVYYNRVARELNTSLDIFPTKIIGSLLKIEKAELFEIDDTV